MDVVVIPNIAIKFLRDFLMACHHFCVVEEPGILGRTVHLLQLAFAFSDYFLALLLIRCETVIINAAKGWMSAYWWQQSWQIPLLSEAKPNPAERRHAHGHLQCSRSLFP